MEAKDLMIGDWVYNTHNQQPEQVCEIMERMVMLSYNDLYDYDEIESIPLTQDILKNNGFNVVQYSDGDYYADIMFEDQGRRVEVEYRYGVDIDVCVIDHNNTSLLSRVDTQVRYIHELQNLFRIMQINKEIVF